MPTRSHLGRLIPVGLRLSTLGLRFLLIFFLARLLPVEEVGLYGLVLATVSFVIFIFGFDFYTYSMRQLLRSGPDKRRTFLKSQVAFSVVLYAIGIPSLLLLFTFGLLPWSVVLWFLLLVPLEHIGTEIDRTLIAVSDQLGASVGLFVRQALLTIVTVPALFLVPAWRSIDVVLMLWVLFDALGVLIGAAFLVRHLKGQPSGSVDWTWIRAGARLALPFLIGTLCLRGLFTFDRQAVAWFGDLAMLGAYTLFMSIGAGMTQVIHAGVHQFTYPRLVTTVHDKNRAAFRQVFRSLTVQTVAGVAAISIAIVAVEPLLLRFVNATEYIEYAWTLPWIMIVTAIYNLSLIPHYGLYAHDADKTILFTTIAAFAVFLITTMALLPLGVVVAVISAVGSASAVLLISKGIAYIRVDRTVWKELP
ncbi:lipopolysaccharide biosynthesis protein [Microbacterium sp. AK031]|uniref:lipopolysaccharide biosynthesis protein n=1 Tax=Microbacterium sp. AK031 TaxID=2723076 RepID=UPI002168FC90|nr:oligosaccharide flippase family protein [Microbacterium sp. AK031]MCS3841743.1 O-antigen/teichoic acid export membrane protein [Microbacterium sp. AK031]